MKRELETLLQSRLLEDRSIALLGPRQSGKSYLLRHFGESNYINLDDPLLREEVKQDPLAYLRRHYSSGKPLFIDEAAKVPAVFEAVKILIDEKEAAPSNICLSNSGNYLLMKRIKESLAGRISLLSLYPLSWREFCGSKNIPGIDVIINALDLPENLPIVSYLEIERSRNERLLWGGYPTPTLHAKEEQKKRWAADYFRTYIFPILLEQFNLRAIEAFEKCARLLFIQSAQTLNYNRLAKITGISQPTAVSYVHQLEAMMLIIILEPYFNNQIKRILKQPKVHVADPLLLHQSFGTDFNLQTAKERGILGAVYESFIVFEIIKTLENYGKPYRLYHWRTADKAEVDIIIEIAGKIIPIEIKSSQSLSGKDSSGLKSFLEDSSHIPAGYIIHPGKQISKLSDKIYALPDWWFLGAW